MTKTEFLKLALQIVGAVALVLVAVGVLRDDDAPPIDNQPTARGVSNFDAITLSGDLVVAGASTLDDVTVGGDLTASDDLSVTGGLTTTGTLRADGNLLAGGIVNLDATSYALTGTQTLTPSASFYALAPTAALTITLATGGASSGDVLWLLNTANQSVVIVDTTATAGGSSRTLAQRDFIGFIFNGTVWYEAFFSDNS